MKIEDSTHRGKCLIDCRHCGKMYEVDDFRDSEFFETIRDFFETARQCPDCKKIAESNKKAQEITDRLPAAIRASGLQPNYINDRATGKLFTEPPCRYAAEWIYRNRLCNLLVSGVTGSGKSTSASFVAIMLLREGRKVRYIKLRELLTKWKQAKTSDRDLAVDQLLNEIFRQELFIIDEVVGKAKVSESGQELLFEILESVNSGACKSRIWLLGNFYTGCIEEIFSDPEPVRRRLWENFKCGCLDKPNQTVHPLSVWKEQS